jgi:hypothetical protein
LCHGIHVGRGGIENGGEADWPNPPPQAASKTLVDTRMLRMRQRLFIGTQNAFPNSLVERQQYNRMPQSALVRPTVFGQYMI